MAWALLDQITDMAENSVNNPKGAGRPVGSQRSKLVPYTSRLRRMVINGRSVREITAWMMNEHGVPVNTRTITWFINSRDLRKPKRIRARTQQTGSQADPSFSGRRGTGPAQGGTSIEAASDAAASEEGDFKLGFDPDKIVFKKLPRKPVDEEDIMVRRMLEDAAKKDDEDGLGGW